MEAAGAPRLDVERLRAGPPLNAGRWSAWAVAPGQEQGCRFPAHAGAVAEERSARRKARGALPQLRARDAGVLSSSSDPS